MNSAVLLTGTPSKLLVDLAHECLSRKKNVLMTTEPGVESPAIPSGLEDNLHYIEWNRRSPISSRFVLLQAGNKNFEIEHTILVISSKVDRSNFHDANAAFLEERIDFDIKGHLFMIKEILSHIIKRGSGSITFVLQNTGPDDLPPLEQMTMNAFEGLVESMFAQYGNEAYALRGIMAKGSQNRQIAEFTLGILEENSPKTKNKWSKYGIKSGLFGLGGK